MDILENISKSIKNKSIMWKYHNQFGQTKHYVIPLSRESALLYWEKEEQRTNIGRAMMTKLERFKYRYTSFVYDNHLDKHALIDELVTIVVKKASNINLAYDTVYGYVKAFKNILNMDFDSFKTLKKVDVDAIDNLITQKRYGQDVISVIKMGIKAYSSRDLADRVDTLFSKQLKVNVKANTQLTQSHVSTIREDVLSKIECIRSIYEKYESIVKEIPDHDFLCHENLAKTLLDIKKATHIDTRGKYIKLKAIEVLNNNLDNPLDLSLSVTRLEELARNGVNIWNYQDDFVLTWFVKWCIEKLGDNWCYSDFYNKKLSQYTPIPTVQNAYCYIHERNKEASRRMLDMLRVICGLRDTILPFYISLLIDTGINHCVLSNALLHYIQKNNEKIEAYNYIFDNKIEIRGYKPRANGSRSIHVKANSQDILYRNLLFAMRILEPFRDRQSKLNNQISPLLFFFQKKDGKACQINGEHVRLFLQGIVEANDIRDKANQPLAINASSLRSSFFCRLASKKGAILDEVRQKGGLSQVNTLLDNYLKNEEYATVRRLQICELQEEILTRSFESALTNQSILDQKRLELLKGMSAYPQSILLFDSRTIIYPRHIDTIKKFYVYAKSKEDRYYQAILPIIEKILLRFDTDMNNLPNLTQAELLEMEQEEMRVVQPGVLSFCGGMK